MIWIQPVGVIVLVFLWRFWLAIKSGTDSVVPVLVGNSQLCGGCQPTLMVENIYYDMILELPSIVGNAGCLVLCVGSLPKYDIFTIELTNMYFKWAIKLFGNYKKSIMIRKVCWMCYKSDEKFMIKYFIIYLKTRLSS